MKFFSSSIFAPRRTGRFCRRDGRSEVSPWIRAAFSWRRTVLPVALAVMLVLFFLTPGKAAAADALRVGDINGVPFSLDGVTLHSKTACVRVYRAGEQVDLLDLRKNNSVYAASLTKMMTLYTSYRLMEEKGIAADLSVTALSSDLEGLAESDASVMGLVAGESLSYKDVLYGLILPSGADAGNLLSRTLGEGRSAFIDAMNRYAAELGLAGSNFTNTSGLFDPDNVTTMSDMTTLLHVIYEEPFLRDIISARTYTTAPTNKSPGGHELTHTIVRTGLLKGIDTGDIEGGKTGYLPESGYCLASYKTIGDALVVIATTGAFQEGDNLRDHNALYKALQKQWPAAGSPVALVGAPEPTAPPSAPTGETKETSPDDDSENPDDVPPPSQSLNTTRTVGIVLASLLLLLAFGLLLFLILRNKKEDDDDERARRGF